MSWASLIAAVVLLLAQTCWAFYIPGMAPSEFAEGDKLEIRAVKMTSVKTQLPYGYYSLPFCAPESTKMHYKTMNLGEVLRGDRIVNTLYNIEMLREVTCQVLCEKELTAKESDLFISYIKDDYIIHMLLDNLPAASVFKNLKTKAIQYEDGFKLGFLFGDKPYLNNHLDISVLYHPVIRNDMNLYRIVGFEVEPHSIAMASMAVVEKNGQTQCALVSGDQPDVLEIKKESANKVRFTYSVQFKKSEIAWASRWDTYLRMSDVQIHWFAICNSVAIVLFLSGILALILIRTLRRDIARYNRDEELDDALEETGWKLVHGDVFRPPRYPTLLVACVGSGIQLFCMMLIVLLFAMFGMLSPASRGALMTTSIVLFMFMGLIAGYHAARLFRTLRGTQWKMAATLTATLYPGYAFGSGLFLNMFIWGERSSGAVPLPTMVLLLFLWFGIAFPLVFAGFYFGFRKQPYEHPVRTNQIPRQIPEQPWYLNLFLGSLVAGILPFGAMFVELFFILTAIWEEQFYYLFGFLFLVFIILIVACSEVSIAMVYFQLCAENYHWWWRTMIISGSPSYYVLAYSVVYYFTKLEIEHFIPTLLYFGYTMVMVVGFWLLTATIGFYATYFFIRRIYAAVKQD